VGELGKRPFIWENRPRAYNKTLFGGAKKHCFDAEGVFLSEGANLFQKNLKKIKKSFDRRHKRIYILQNVKYLWAFLLDVMVTVKVPVGWI